MNNSRYRYSYLLPIENIKRQLRALIMTEKISPTKYGWEDIEYLRHIIARMERGKELRT